MVIRAVIVTAVYLSSPAKALRKAESRPRKHVEQCWRQLYNRAWHQASEFSEALYPGPEFSQGNYFALTPGDARKAKTSPRIHPPERWSFSVPDRIFGDFVSARERSGQKQYYLYGHSAGAQFVHRLAALAPSGRIKLAIAANAGWYTLPDLNSTWPYGFKGTNMTAEQMNRFLAFPLVILLGEKDTDPHHPQLRRNARADEQGITRFARGQYFFESGRRAARSQGSSFGWRLQTVPGAAHSNAAMAKKAVLLVTEDAGNRPGR